MITFYKFKLSKLESANLSALRVFWTCKKVSDPKLLLEKAIKLYFFIQNDASSFAEFKISDFEIDLSRFDCTEVETYDVKI